MNQLEIAGKTFEWGRRTYIMGIVNLTPDSFSGDGMDTDPSLALEQVRHFGSEADILDLGAESTRPTPPPVTVEAQLARPLPPLKANPPPRDRLISVDTMKPEVARAALEAGAHIINDVTGLADPPMRELVAARGVPA